MKKPNDLPVGEAVYYAREESIGIVYETYSRGDGERPGVQVILSTGKDLSGFSPEEADRFLTPLGDTGLVYEFKSVLQLADDFRKGVFTEAFDNAHIYRLNYIMTTPTTNHAL